MSKRKYQEISSSRSALSTKLSVKQQRQQEIFHGHIENAQAQLLGALKWARGPERQKLGRRQKDARGKKEQNGNSEDEERIDAEIKALNALDLSKAAEFYILRTLCRIKTIAGSLVMPPELLQKGSAPSPYQKPPAVANVTARLFKSMAVRKAMEAIVAEARKIVASVEQQSGSEQVSNNGQGGVANIELGKPSDEDLEQPESESHASGISEREIGDLRSRQDSEENDSDLSMDEDEGFAARLASDSEAESGSDNKDISTGDNASTDSRNQPNIQNSRPSPPRPAKSKQQPSKPSVTTTKPLKKTTFLPTLASGYFSGSESDSYQSENEKAAEKPKPKNRMGQRARQALAEQQYGSGANHLNNSKSNKKSKRHGTRDSGWDPKKGAVDGTGKRYVPRNNPRSNITPHPSYEQKEQQPKPRAKDNTGPLHASWEAKRKMKEKQSQSININMPQGKKVIFD